MTVYKERGWEHDWVASTLGHGERMCRRCKMTNRESWVLGRCQVPPAEKTKEQDDEDR